MCPEREDVAESGRQTRPLPPEAAAHPAGTGRGPPPAEARGAQRDRSARRSPSPKGEGYASGVGLGQEAREGLPAAGDRCWLTVGRALGTVVVTVRGLLDRTSGPVLDRLLVDLIDGQGNQTVAVDLLSATVEGTDGMRPLLAAARRTSERGTRFVLNAPSPALWLELIAKGCTVEFENATDYRLPPA